AQGVRRPGARAHRGVHLLRRDPAHRLPDPVPHPVRGRPDPRQARHRRAEGAAPAPHLARRAPLRHRLHPARGRPRPPIHAAPRLAPLRTRAVHDANDYTVNGQKVFTSQAEYADYIWLAVRTDPAAPRHKGISLLMVDARAPGVSMTPIQTLAGTRTNATY